jgi:glutamyl-tRNA reductase
VSVLVAGLSHHTSPVHVRERLHFDDQALPSALRTLKSALDCDGVVIVSTCNRVELYATGVEDVKQAAVRIRAFLSEQHDLPESEFAECLYEHTNSAAVAHLFRVASSLDSLVVGEAQILGQVQDAYQAAQAEVCTDKVMSALFQRAFSVAKKVRTDTAISAGKVSIGSVAVDLAVSIFRELIGKTVMVVGTGKMGELTLTSLVGQGVDNLLLVNRSLDKAEDLAKRVRAESIALADIRDHLHRADIIVSSTASDAYLLGPEDFTKALKDRGNAPMFVIDIAVPRDIDPKVNDLNDIYLYDVDSLQQVADANLEARRQEIAKCMEIVERGVETFTKWERSLMAEPTIVSMTAEWDGIRDQELQKTLNALPDLTDKQRDEIEYLTKRIVKNIMQHPMKQLKQEVITEDPHSVLQMVKRLFGLKESS